MDNLKNEQTEAILETNAENVAVEREAEASFGKFKDVNALLNSYNSLQAEFTKRCQRIKELENELLSVDKSIPTKSESDSITKKQEDITPEIKDQAIRDYLKGILSRKSNTIVMDGAGTGVNMPVRRPKTVRAAGELAKELLSKN